MTKPWCVYASNLVDAVGQTMSPGDGITSSTRKLYALAGSQAEAEQIKARLESGKLLSRVRIPGDKRLYPELEVGRYDPLDFVGQQNRDEYTGKRYATLCGRLAEEAARNASEIL